MSEIELHTRWLLLCEWIDVISFYFFVSQNKIIEYSKMSVCIAIAMDTTKIISNEIRLAFNGLMYVDVLMNGLSPCLTTVKKNTLIIKLGRPRHQFHICIIFNIVIILIRAIWSIFWFSQDLWKQDRISNNKLKVILRRISKKKFEGERTKEVCACNNHKNNFRKSFFLFIHIIFLPKKKPWARRWTDNQIWYF